MRKETTIAALTQRTSLLEGMIEEMNRTLLTLNDQATRADIARLKPDFAQSLNSTAQRFASLAQEATASHRDDADNGGSQTLLEEQRPDSEPLANHSQNQTPMPMHTNIQWTPPSDQGQIICPVRAPSIHNLTVGTNHGSCRPNLAPILTGGCSAPPTGSAPMIGMGYQLLYEDQGLAAECEGPASLPFVHILEPDHKYGVVPRSASFMPHCRFGISPGENPPSLSLNRIRTLESPHTYSFQETTFARRLQRAAIEIGYKLALHASQRPDAFKHVFRLVLPWESRDQIVERFESLLLRTTHESLDFWTTPFLHIGGAGTHYARRDANGNVVPKPNSYIVRSIGPHRLAKLEDATGAGMTPDLFIDITGLEGEWFDPNDVEGYLRERGFVINPQSSFAEGKIADRSASPLSFLTRGSTRSEGSSPLTPQSNSAFDVEPCAASSFEMNSGYNTSNLSGLPALSYQNYPDRAHPSSKRASTATGSSLNPASLIIERHVTIDVQQFINSKFAIHFSPKQLMPLENH